MLYRISSFTVPRPHRSFVTTARREETPDTVEFMRKISETSLYKQLSSNPEAVKSVENLYHVMKEAGVSLETGKPPSNMQMMRLAMNRKFMKTFKTCMEEFQKAGIDLKSDGVMEEIMGNFAKEAQVKKEP